MKTEKITITFSQEKLQAIQVHAPEVYAQLENQLEDALEKIYIKTVPASTRKYVEAVIQMDAAPNVKNNKG